MIKKFILVILAIFFAACGTLTQPKITTEKGYSQIPYEKAFEYVLRAGDDIGFEPAKYPKPDKEKGIVILMAKAETGERVAKALFFTVLWKHFVLEVRINRDGNIAKGVNLKVTQAGGATIKREEMENLVKAYTEALERYWK